MRRRGPENVDELRVIAKVLVWLQGTKTGDRGEINLNGPTERQAWMRLSAEDEACTTENCLKHTDGACPFYRVHRTAQNAHLVIVNHALLLADVATGNRVLPEYEYLIVDEAHHLEDATTDLLDEVDEVLKPGEIASFNELVQHATDHAFQFQNLLRQFFKNIVLFLSEQRDGRPVGMYSHRERIITATRSQPAWSDVEISWDEAQNALQSLIDTMEKIIQGVAEVNDKFPEGDEELHSTLSNIYRHFIEFNDQVSALVFEPVTDQVYWAEEGQNNSRLALHAAPVHIGSLMERYVWHEKSAVILTSATLTTLGEFDYLRGRLNAEDAYELMLGSPFDFETASLLYLVNDIPEPNDRQRYQKAVGQGLIRLCQATGGRTLALFTSYDQLRRTSRAITPVLAKQDIQVYVQGEGASPHALLEAFRNSERAVLLGTRAFWEGVDVPGEALSVLVIVKLPFDVPSDPIIAARAESFDDSFYQYSLPEAILRFRQGFGRLIRSQNDRGVVAIFDRRVISKKYGRFFIESLPQCTVQVGPLSDLPANASRWLNI
jgi:DNA polymerase-3 subunit epsilon/ATP-dependent DNA helicase DinG